jgi:glycosyltransferase involved in cell wall biosynthesis
MNKPNDERPYRILMIAPTSFFADYGCHIRILEETRTLQQRGHAVTLVTYRNGRDLPGIDIRRTLPIPWRQSYEVGSSRHKIAFDALLGAKTLYLLMRQRFDVIHTHLHEGALIGLVLGRLFDIPVLFDFQGSLTEEMIDHHFLRRDGKMHTLLRRLETWIDHTSPLILTSSANAERILIEQFQSDPARIRSLQDCVNTDEFRPAAAFASDELARLRVQLGIPADAKVIVYLGLLAEYQGTPHLLQAMQHLQARHEDVYLLLMGFPGVEYYQQQAAALGVRDRVIFTGRVFYEEAARHLALGQVAVAPKLSLTEGAGKLLNYMAMGLPTVAFDTPVAHEYLGMSGLYAKLGSVESLASHLNHVLEDPLLGERLGQQLRQRAVDHFQWQRAGAQLEAAYATLCDEPTVCDEPAASQAAQRFPSHQK